MDEKKGTLERINKKISSLTTFLKNIKTLAVVAILAGVIIVAALSDKRWDIARTAYCKTVAILDVPCEVYVDVQREEPALLIVQDLLEREGISTTYSEFSVYKVSDSEMKYRWRRNDAYRTYKVYRDTQNIWNVDRIE